MKAVISERQPKKTTYSNGRVEEFKPFLRWRIADGWMDIGFPKHYGFGLMWKFKKGCWSRIKTKFFVIGRWTFYIDLGECPPWNPTTGETYKSKPLAD